MANRFNDPVEQALDNAGTSLAAAQLFFFESGTSTPLDTFSDEALTIVNLNPVEANGAGRFPDIFLKPQDYKVQLKTSIITSSVQIWERDPVKGTADSDAKDITYLPNFTDAERRTLQSKLEDTVNVKDFGVVGDGITNDTTNFNAAMAYMATLTEPKTLVATGSFLLDLNTIWNAPDNMTLDFTGAIFIPSSTDVNATFIQIRGKRAGAANKPAISDPFSGPESTTVLTADALVGSTSFVVADATGIEENDLVCLFSEEEFEKQTASGKPTIEPARVSSVDGLTVYIDAPLLVEFTQAGNIAGGGTGFPDVKLFKTAQKVTILGGTFQMDEKAEIGLKVSEVNSLLTTRQRWLDPLRQGLSLTCCSGDVHTLHEFRRSGVNAANDGSPPPEFGYGIFHRINCYSRVSECMGARGWHSYEVTHGQRDITYDNLIGVIESQSISSHADCISMRVTNCRLENQTSIHARARYCYIENCLFNGTFNTDTNARGIEWGENSWELHVRNNRFIGEYGNSFMINATAAIRPTNSTVKEKSRAYIIGNVFDGDGGLISVQRGARKIVFRGNTIVTNDFNITVPKTDFHVFDNGNCIIEGNAFVDNTGGGLAFIGITGETSDVKFSITANTMNGESQDGGASDFVSLGSTSASGVEVMFDHNTLLSDNLRFIFNMGQTFTTRSFCHNSIISTVNTVKIFRQTGSATDNQVDFFCFNNMSCNIADKTTGTGGSTTTFSQEFFNVFADTV